MTQVQKMVTSIKKESPLTQILIVLPPDHFTWKYRSAEVNNNILTLRAALIPWLKSQKIPWYDFFEVMGGSGSIRTWQRNKYAEGDLIHFTYLGYELWGKLLGTALINNFLYSLIRDEAH
jgi:lysophospholipase L1-like esterase